MNGDINMDEEKVIEGMRRLYDRLIEAIDRVASQYAFHMMASREGSPSIGIDCKPVLPSDVAVDPETYKRETSAEIAEALRKAGYKVDIIEPRDPEEERKQKVLLMDCLRGYEQKLREKGLL